MVLVRTASLDNIDHSGWRLGVTWVMGGSSGKRGHITIPIEEGQKYTDRGRVGLIAAPGKAAP